MFGGFLKLGVPFWGPNSKDYSILGSILGSPYLQKLPFWDSKGTMEEKMETIPVPSPVDAPEPENPHIAVNQGVHFTSNCFPI